MNHVPLSSTHLESIAHDGKTLEVRFKNGQIYSYSNVPREIFQSLLASPSPGTTFNDLVKNQFPFRK
jgi:hypothetical protein